MVWKWFRGKTFLISRKNICFVAIQNDFRSEYFKLEQRSVITFVVAEKYKPCES